jgi:urea transporter
MSTGTPVPFWRQVLRGFSQCAFQANETTGLVFVLAVAVANWRLEAFFGVGDSPNPALAEYLVVAVSMLRMAAFFIIAVFVGTATARLLRGVPVLLDLGLYGFNSGLIGLALGNFFEPSALMSLWVVLFAIVAAMLTVAWSKWVPIPFLAAPFILTFWLIWLLADPLGMNKVDFGAFPEMKIEWMKSVVAALGSALFVPSLWSGAVFLVGIAISNWRHAIVAVIGALVANALAVQAGAVGGAVNFGFIGFNGVLAALAAYVIIAPDLRLVVLASLSATWLASYVFRGLPVVPVLASGFVLAVWAILLLGWLNPRFAAKAATPATS